MLQHVLDLAAHAELTPVVVVLGEDGDELEASCDWRSELRLRNRAPQDGLATSVQVGIGALHRLHAGRAAVLMGDQPFLAPEQLAAIVATPGQIVVPRFGGLPGNPVVLDHSVWPLAASLKGDRGFAQLFTQHVNLVTYVDVEGSNPDVDTEGDLNG